MVPDMVRPEHSARSATALYTNATSHPIICKGPRCKRGRFRSGLSLSYPHGTASTNRSWTSTRWPCSWFCRVRKSGNKSSGSAVLVVYNGCQRSFLGPGRTSRQTMVRIACSASSSLSMVWVSARRTSLGGASTHTPGSWTETNRPLGNCFQAHAVRVATGAQGDLQVGVLLGQVPQRPHARVRLARAGIEQGVQTARPALTQHLLHQGHRQVLQVAVSRRAARTRIGR